MSLRAVPTLFICLHCAFFVYLFFLCTHIHTYTYVGRYAHCTSTQSRSKQRIERD
ncbi:hypothetical protein COCSADRAFT_228045 [Bipolaris sorokiniana ND90Pr]|uniref:Uncharacterized protein n=1 Tax=Cochliobolus sativus (strain ND90Pr / ATCC 201652) TaxID=665912 RepID=M2SYU6_COCSN|nr:uncharacterized protein COCSADRAFT_228045 [Bipolaris sorokiniana ND90Pr]EMD62096.1 hypothetical protein COCSADRAFT_228045 [Bipolaris sorokiniana ND90Pr]